MFKGFIPIFNKGVYIIILLLTMLFFISVNGQTTFTESAASYGLNLGQNKDGGHAWSDFDKDGLLDVLVLENNNSSSVKSFLMHQGPAGTFTNVQATLAPGMLGDFAERQAVWGDVNSDGRPDFMINSSGNSNSRKAIQIFIQNTNGTFGDGAGGSAPITIGRTGATINISGINSEGTGFFDFEGDGDLDIFFDNHGSGIELLRNNYIDHTTHTVVNPISAALYTHITPGNGSGVVEYGLNQFATDGDYGSAADVNDDGWVDIFMRKRNENDFFLNQGGTFTNGSDLAQAYNNNKGGNGLWDLDNDGDLDAVWTENGLTQIFRNDGPGVWTPLGATTFPGLPQPSNTSTGSSSNDIDALTAGDIDNDGDIDILFIGDSRSYLFVNQLNSPTPAPGVIGSGSVMSFTLDSETFNNRNGEGATMVDIDDDGDLDIYINISHSSGNQLYVNNLPVSNRNNHLLIDVSEDRGANGSTGGLPARIAVGTNVLIRDCSGNIVSGLRQVNGVYGHGTQSPEEVHFGLPLGENETYIIEVRYPNFYDSSEPSGYSRLISTIIATPSTISGTNHYDMSTTDAEILENVNPPDAEDDIVVVPIGNTVSVQINLFDNDSEPDGEDFFIESVVQPAIGSVVIDDAELGLVTYTYNAGTLFTGTNFDYTITDSSVTVCPALGKSDTATVYIEEPCADLTGIDTDGDGINDTCDLDDDNDGILDTDECLNTTGLVTNGDFLNWIYSSGWSGSVWNINTQRAWYAQWSGTGSKTFSQTINVSSGIENTITFDVGANAAYSGEVIFNAQIDGVTQLSETSTSISSTNGGNATNGNATLNMATRSFSFTPVGNSVTLTFEGTSPTSNHDIIYVDNVFLTTGCIDSDGDTIPNYLDLDSDNDGIYDVIEAGHDVSHTSGRLIGSFGLDGIANSVQASGQEDAGTTNYIVLDSDSDSNKDFIEIDSDNDGCLDVIEAGFTESSSNTGELQGTGYNLSIGVIIGNANGYTPPVDANTDLQLDYRIAGSSATISMQPQDQSVADGSNTTFSVTVTGTSIAFQWQVSTDDGVVYTNISGANASSYTVVGASTSEDQNRYKVLITDSSFICDALMSNAALLTIAIDSDNDGVIDIVDLDDDNDGIYDEVEASNCALGDPNIDVVIFSEDFGTANGNRVQTTYSNYAYEDGSGSAGADGDLQDGEYVIFEDISATAFWASAVWQNLGDHTSGSDRMMIVNSDNTAGLEFYRRSLVQVTENVPLNISFWVMNMDIDSPSNTGRIEPNITANIQQGGVTVHSFNTGTVAREANGDANAWKEFIGSFIPTTNSALELVLINNAPGGGGNDLALDDIQVTQAFCDSDGNGVPNSLQADSDDDGCNDSDEAYGNVNTDIDDNGMYGSGTPIVNLDGTVTAASYITPQDANTNSTFDFLEAGTAPVITLEPINTIICPGCTGDLSVLTTNADGYQWQIFNGTNWVDLTNSGIYSGVNLNILTITNPTNIENGNQYRVLVSNTMFVCAEATSNTSVLTVRVNTVITNRRITHRVKKN